MIIQPLPYTIPNGQTRTFPPFHSPFSSTTKMFQHHQSKIYRQNGSAAASLLFTPFPSGRGDTLEHQNHIYRRTGTVPSPPTKRHTIIDWTLTTNQLTAEQTNQTASPRRRIRCFVTELNLHACMDGWAGGWLGGRLLISSGRPCWSAAGFWKAFASFLS